MSKGYIWVLIIGAVIIWYGFHSGFLAVALGTPKALQEGINLMKS